MAKALPKTVHEAFSRFFETPTRESLRALLKDHVGEARNLDFKESWPDNATVARHILGISNLGGGCLIVGVKENDDKSVGAVGIPQIKDKSDVINGIKLYIPAPLVASLEIADFSYSAAEYPALIGKTFQVVLVHGRDDELPYVAQRTGAGVRSGAIYIRREASTDEATYEEVQRLVARRLAAAPQTTEARNLKEHLEELKVLYSEIPKDFATSIFFDRISALDSIFSARERNTMFPEESYQAFVRRMLDQKKKIIERLIGISADDN